MNYKLKREKIKKKFVVFEEHIRKISRFGSTNKEEIVRINMNDDVLNDKDEGASTSKEHEVHIDMGDDMDINKDSDNCINIHEDIDANKDSDRHINPDNSIEIVADEDTPLNIDTNTKINIKKNKRLNLKRFKFLLDSVIPEDSETSIIRSTSKMSEINTSESSSNMSNTIESILPWTMCVFS